MHNGAAVVIDDAGVGMDGTRCERAAALLSGQQAVDIYRLGDPPQFGFAVIGLLAARYGFSVSVDTRSPYGGVRAVVFLPTALLTRVEPRSRVAAAASAAPAVEPAHPASADPHDPLRPPHRPPRAVPQPQPYASGRTPAGDASSRRPPRRTRRPPRDPPAGARRSVTTYATAGGLPKRRTGTSAERRRTTGPRPPRPTRRAPRRPADETASRMGASHAAPAQAVPSPDTADRRGNPQA